MLKCRRYRWNAERGRVSLSDTTSCALFAKDTATTPMPLEVLYITYVPMDSAWRVNPCIGVVQSVSLVTLLQPLRIFLYALSLQHDAQLYRISSMTRHSSTRKPYGTASQRVEYLQINVIVHST